MESRHDKQCESASGELTPTLDGKILPPYDSLRPALNEVVTRYKDQYSRGAFVSLLADLCLEKNNYANQFGTSEDTQSRIVEELARVFAEIGFPTRTDYSIVDPSGRQNQQEDWFFADLEYGLHALLPTSEEKAAIGRRAIEIACETHLEKTSYQFPAAYSDSHQFAYHLVQLKSYLNVDLTPDDVTVVAALRSVLPGLRYRGDDFVVLRHLGSGFDAPEEMKKKITAEALQYALLDVKARWYGDSHQRLVDAIDFKERYAVPTTENDKNLVLEYVEAYWDMEQNTRERLVTSFNISYQEFRTALIAGIDNTLLEYRYDQQDAHWYLRNFEAIAEYMQEFEIRHEDLQYDFEASLNAVALCKEHRLLEQYCKVGAIPPAIFMDPAHRAVLGELIQTEIGRICKNPSGNSKAALGWLEGLNRSAAADLSLEIIREEGSRLLAKEPLYAFNHFCEALKIESGLAKVLFQSSAAKRMRQALAEAVPEEAKKVSELFGITFTQKDERSAALAGVRKIFADAVGAELDYRKLGRLLKAVEIKGIIDDEQCRSAVRPVLLASLTLNTSRGIENAAWLHHRFAFRGGLTGPDVLPAVKQGLKTALLLGNARHVRFAGECVAKKFPSKDVGEVIRTVWREANGSSRVLEHLKAIPAGGLHHVNRELGLADYVRDIGVLGPVTYDRYIEHRNSGRKTELQGFISRVRKEMDSLISVAPQNIVAMRVSPRYRELILTVYPNNWGPEASFENAESCEDHSEHLEHYRIREHQSFTLADGVKMKVKDGLSLDTVPVEILEEQISETVAGFGSGKEIDRVKQSILRSVGASPDLSAYDSRIFSTAVDLAAAGQMQNLQSLLIANRLASFDDMQNYMRGTRAHVEDSKNGDYVNLLELQDFLGDQMRESIDTLVSNALCTESGRLCATVRYTEIVAERDRELHREVLLKARPEKLGMSDSFLEQFQKQHKLIAKKKIGADECRELIESCDLFLTDSEPGGSERQMPAGLRERLLPLVRSQRERTLQFAKAVGRQLPENVPLAAVNVRELSEFKETAAIESVDLQTLHEFFLEHLYDAFRSHRDALGEETAKFEADSETARSVRPRTVNAYITKNATSAHARKSAGVCVSVDNPGRTNGRTSNQWDMPEFFQMVLQDDNSKICLGAVLLHAYTDPAQHTSSRGTKILVASFNPSSTFLYQVDEKELFSKLLSQLKQFAIDNSFDKIAVSSKRYNRTNRVGGDFEKAMMEYVAEIDEEYKLERPQPICHAFNYTNDELAVIWNHSGRVQQAVSWIRNLFS